MLEAVVQVSLRLGGRLFSAQPPANLVLLHPPHAGKVTSERLGDVPRGYAPESVPALAVEAQLPGCLVRDPSCGSSISIAHWFALVLQGRLVFGDRAVLDLEAS